MNNPYSFGRFKEAVQGKELERIFREEGVIDEDEPEEEDEDELEEKVNTGDHDGNDGKSDIAFLHIK
jgi:hypothetical protein